VQIMVPSAPARPHSHLLFTKPPVPPIFNLVAASLSNALTILMKKILMIVAGVVVVGLIVLVVVFTLSLDTVIKKGVETVGPQITKTEVKLDGVKISVLSGSGALKGFLLGNPEGYTTPSAVKVGEIGLGVDAKSVMSDKVHVKYVLVQGAEFTFEGTLGTKNNLSKILENVESVTGGKSAEPAKKEKEAAGPSKKLQVDDFLISGAKANVSMTMLAGKSLTVAIPDIHLTNLGTGPDGITAGELTKRVFNEVVPAVLKAVEKGVADLGKAATDTVTHLGKDASTNLDKTAKSIGDLLHKK